MMDQITARPAGRDPLLDRLYQTHAAPAAAVLAPRAAPAVTAAQRIIDAECRRCDISFAELVSHYRGRRIVMVRREIAYRLRIELDMSLPRIGAALHREASSIMGLLGKRKPQHLDAPDA
jgi:chromosomal replication initiation ATPase DnaA